MAQELRANTAVDVLLGPFVDDTDGKTLETGLTISQADVKLSKLGQAQAQKNDANAAAHDANAMYNCPFDATDTNSEGTLDVVVAKAGALVVVNRFMVLAEAAWDSKYSPKDDGFMDVNIKTIGRADTQETEASNLESACANYSATRGLSGTALPAAAADAAGGLPISDAGGLDLDAKLAATNEITAARMSELDAGTAGKMAYVTDTIDTKIGTPTDLGNGTATLSGMVSHVDDEVDTVLQAVDSIAVTGAPLNLVANGRTLTTGTESSGTYADTYFDNGVYHVLAVSGTTIDIEYLFTIPATLGVPSSVKIVGYMKEAAPAGEDTIALMAYNYSTPGWDTIDPAVFTGIITDGPDVVKTHELRSVHVGTSGGDDRKMRIRFYSTTLEAATLLRLDQVIVGYSEAISTSVASILADTNELQTDWTNGGRLDNILDTVAADVVNIDGAAMRGTDNAALAIVCTETRLSELDAGTAGKMANQVDEIRTDTEYLQTQIGTAGDGLTGIPWNATWDTEVQSECFDALNAAITSGGAPTANSMLGYMQKVKYVTVNDMDIDEATGGATINDDSGSPVSTSGSFTTLAGVTSRTKLI